MNLLRELRKKGHEALDRLAYRWHETTLKRRLYGRPAEYQEYFVTQLRRTLYKRKNPLPARAKHLIDRTAETVDLTRSRVLCVGCRNTAELDYFRRKGAKSAIGIDLFSPRSDVLLMDMHAMTFDEESFDVIYSSHSLEHALRPHEVVREFIRTVRGGGVVVVEVPVNYEVRMTQDADISDFGSLEGLRALFAPHVDQVLWSETSRAGDFSGELGTDAVRVIMRIRKQP